MNTSVIIYFLVAALVIKLSEKENKVGIQRELWVVWVFKQVHPQKPNIGLKEGKIGQKMLSGYFKP